MQHLQSKRFPKLVKKNSQEQQTLTFFLVILTLKKPNLFSVCVILFHVLTYSQRFLPFAL